MPFYLRVAPFAAASLLFAGSAVAAGVEPTDSASGEQAEQRVPPVASTTPRDEPSSRVVSPVEPSRTVLRPVAGVMFGSLFTVPVRRVSLGLEVGKRHPSGLAILGTSHLDLGSTENGLDSHRLDLGASVGFSKYVEVLAGLHVAYAIVVRNTQEDSFVQALLGNIGGFAVGVHGSAGAQIPIGRRSLGLHARVFAERFDSGNGFGAGPNLSFTF